MSRLTQLKIPFVVGVVVEADAASTRDSLDLAAREGADCAELNLPALSALEVGWFQGKLPVYTTCRRAAFMKVYGEDFSRMPAQSDEARMEIQKEALSLGSAGLDIEADTFDPQPDEWSECPKAVARQQALAESAHQANAAVIFSWHPPRKLTFEEAAGAMESMAGRGADFVKIVERVESEAEAMDSLAISMRLRTLARVPFVFLALGSPAAQFRLLACSFGSAYLLARPSRGRNTIQVQPLIRRARAMLELTHPDR